MSTVFSLLRSLVVLVWVLAGIAAAVLAVVGVVDLALLPLPGDHFALFGSMLERVVGIVAALLVAWVAVGVANALLPSGDAG